MEVKDLSVIITARNEEFLSRTVEGVLKARRANTEVIVLCDGNWPEPPIKDNPDVVMIYHSKSIGQRAGINEAIKLSTARYIMKLDAHCIVADGFDKVLVEAGDKLGKKVTQVPRMYNLHAFDWKCKKCGNRWYQGPTPEYCCKSGESRQRNKDCDGTEFERVIVWKPRLHRKSDHYRFDNDLKFQYWGALGKRPGFEGDITETMSLLGACFFMNRERYWEIGGSDENWGSWGNQGTEISLKSWLSGGMLVTNRKTWFSHMFRTQGGDFGFPYPQSGKQVSHARKSSQNIFFGNKFDKQIYSLFDLVGAFWPVPGWDKKDLLALQKAGSVFRASHPFTLKTDPLFSTVMHPDGSIYSGSGVSSPTGVGSGDPHVLSVSNNSKVVGVATPAVSTEMVKLETSTGNRSNKKSIGKMVNSNSPAILPAVANSREVKESTISSVVDSPSPIPTFRSVIKVNMRKQAESGSGVNFVDGQVLRHGVSIQQNTDNKQGILYYTDNQLQLKIAHRVQKQLKKASNGKRIVSVSLKPMDFGDNIHLPLKRGWLTMAKQILAGLKQLTNEYVFFCEHDVLYHESHFNFTPPKNDVYYYNTNVWKVRWSDGFAVHTNDCKQLSGMVCNRQFAIKHFEERVKRLETYNGTKFDKYVRLIGFEPGTHNRKERVDDFKAESYQSKYPNIDIRHNGNGTHTKWSPAEFRNKKFAEGWTERNVRSIPGWEKIWR